MNIKNNLLGIKLPSGEELSQSDVSFLSNLYQRQAGNKVPEIALNALDYLDLKVRKGEFVVTSIFFFMRYGSKRLQKSLLATALPKSEVEKLSKHIEDNRLFESKKTDDAKDSALKQFISTVVAARFTLGISDISEISLQKWETFIRPLRDESDRWNDEFMGPHQASSVRDLARCLVSIHNDPKYLSIVKVKRSDKINMGEDLLSSPPEHVIPWVDAWRHYIDASGSYTVKTYLTAFNRFKNFLEEVFLGKEIPTPIEFFSSPQKESFIDWVERNADCGKIKGKNAVVDTVNHNNLFSYWFIDMYLSEYVDGEEKITASFPLLRPAQFDAFKKKYNQPDLKPGESTKESPPLWLRERLKELLSDNDYEWPKSISAEYSTYAIDDDGKLLWVPTNTFLYLIMLEIPVRRIQLIKSDSGEGDVVKYDQKADEWIPNTHPSANYWRNDPTAQVENRGILRQHKKINGKGQNLVIYLNTNKTQDRNVGFTELSGYEIPWKHPEVIRLINELRCWQEKHNPCLHPIKAADVPDTVYPRTLNDAIAKGIPDRFYLFRSARDARGAATRHMPPTERSIGLFWNAAMDELEKRLQSEGLDIQLVLNRNEHGQAQEVLYTPHSLRVAGLTSLAEQGVPIEVLSKLVAGHKSILMTIYYIKHDYAHITEVLNEASHKTLLEAQESFSRWIKEGTWEQVSKYAAYNDEDAVQAITSPRQKAVCGIWNSTHLGLCPYGGTRCHDGGEIIRKKPKAYAPVAEKDCVNCRHIITGRPWLTELTVYGNKLLLDIERKTNQTQDTSAERHRLSMEKHKILKSGETPSGKLITDLKKLDSILEKINSETEHLIRSLHNTHNLIEKIKGLPVPLNEYDVSNSERALSPSLIVSSESSFELDYQESSSNFSTLDYVVQASRIYIHDRNEDYERERDEIMNLVLLNNGLSPIMMLPLSAEEKRNVADEFSKLLVTKATGDEIIALQEGRVTLKELGFSPRIPEEIKPLNLLPTKLALE